jgi:hypothetical protein
MHTATPSQPRRSIRLGCSFTMRRGAALDESRPCSFYQANGV